MNNSINGKIQQNYSPTKAVLGNSADIVHDITELAELQTKLLVTDISSLKNRLILPVISAVVAVCILLGAVPVVLLGVAELLTSLTDVSKYVALFISAGGGVLFSLLLLTFAWLRLRGGFQELDNSRRELQQNLAWIKATLKCGGQQRHAAHQQMKREN